MQMLSALGLRRIVTGLGTQGCERLGCRFHRACDHTALDMIIDQPHCLHERIYPGGTEEFSAKLLQVLGQGDRFR